MKRFRYTPEQLEFLRVGFLTMRIPELTTKFNTRFKLTKSVGAVSGTLKNHKFRCGRKGGNPKGQPLIFTIEQVEFIKENFPKLSIKELTTAFNIHFETEKSINQIKSFTKNHKILSGRSGRFENEHKPWNSGTKGQGLTGANSGSFKKGSIPPNRKPVGSERICSKDGYVFIKVNETNPWNGQPTMYRPKRIVVWEQKNGKVPAGMALLLLDGDKQNCDIENLVLITRAELLYLNNNGYSDLPDEMKPTMRALAKMETKRFSLLNKATK